MLGEKATPRLPSFAAGSAQRSGSRSTGSTVSAVWAGSGERGEPHYYRVQGPTFLIEYDNTQNDANHIHAVWRDPEGDFGFDVLEHHYGVRTRVVGAVACFVYSAPIIAMAGMMTLMVMKLQPVPLCPV